MIMVMQSFTKASISVYTEIQAGVFKFLRFRDGLVWTELDQGLTGKIKLSFQIPPS